MPIRRCVAPREARQRGADRQNAPVRFTSSMRCHRARSVRAAGAFGRAGVGDHDVDRTEGGRGRLDQPGAVRLARDVGHDTGPRQRAQLVERRATPPGDGHRGPIRGERRGNGRADAGAAAGDERVVPSSLPPHLSPRAQQHPAPAPCTLAPCTPSCLRPARHRIRQLADATGSRPCKYGFGHTALS